MNEYHDRLGKAVAQAREQSAKSAIANPGLFPQWGRLMSAKANLEAAQVELKEAQQAWSDLIKYAPSEFKKLAPQV